jgi:hypothetical protein
MRRLVVACLSLTLFAAPALAGPEHDHGRDHEARASKPFGPWDAGKKREVERHGKKGNARPPHPFFGQAAKVPASGPPPPPLRRDPDIPEQLLRTANHRSRLSANPLYLAALVYSNFVTKVDGPRCKHYPTCSRFANQAVGRHGAFGIIMGLDRLIQDGSSSTLRGLPEMEFAGGMVRYFDPLENYEFWDDEEMQAFPPVAPEEPLVLSPLRERARAPRADRAAPKKSFTPCSTKPTIPSPRERADRGKGCVEGS